MAIIMAENNLPSKLHVSQYGDYCHCPYRIRKLCLYRSSKIVFKTFLRLIQPVVFQPTFRRINHYQENSQGSKIFFIQICIAAKKSNLEIGKRGWTFMLQTNMLQVFVSVCVPGSWIESHSYNILFLAKLRSSELVSPNVATTCFGKLGRIAK